MLKTVRCKNGNHGWGRRELNEYAQLLVDRTDGSPAQIEAAHTVAMICWNAAMLGPAKEDEYLKEMGTAALGMTPDELHIATKNTFKPMIRRHREMFPGMDPAKKCYLCTREEQITNASKLISVADKVLPLLPPPKDSFHQKQQRLLKDALAVQSFISPNNPKPWPEIAARYFGMKMDSTKARDRERPRVSMNAKNAVERLLRASGSAICPDHRLEIERRRKRELSDDGKRNRAKKAKSKASGRPTSFDIAVANKAVNTETEQGPLEEMDDRALIAFEATLRRRCEDAFESLKEEMRKRGLNIPPPFEVRS